MINGIGNDSTSVNVAIKPVIRDNCACFILSESPWADANKRPVMIKVMVINATSTDHMTENMVSMISITVVVETPFGTLPELKAKVKKGNTNTIVTLYIKSNFLYICMPI